MSQFVMKSGSRPKAEAELICTILSEIENPACDAVSYNCTNEPRDLWETEAYYPEKPELSQIAALLDPFDIDLEGFVIEPVEDHNWVEESLKGLAPVEAGGFMIHGSHDRSARTPFHTNLEIDAGTAFGTGHHATTTGCLIALDRIARHSAIRNILDVGCGTGVLAIAAALRLHKPAIASDIDPEAVRVAEKNAQRNAAAPFLTCRVATGVAHNDITRNAPYSLIFANILARPLVKLAPAIAPLLATDGHAVLSGLNCHQERWVIAAWRAQGLVVRSRIRIDNWSTLVLYRPSVPQKEKTRHADRTGLEMIADWHGRRFRD